METTQNQIIRIILGAMRSTPNPLLYLDTGIMPLSLRREYLTGKMLIGLSHNTQSPAYKIVKTIFNWQLTWKVRNIPCVVPIKHKIQQCNIKLFQSSLQLVKGPKVPPWKLHRVDTACFPMNKKESLNNNYIVRNKFQEILTNLPTDNIYAFLQMAHTILLHKPVHAQYISQNTYNTKHSWKLTDESSVFTCELHGIKQALKTVFNNDVREITIITDSRAAMEAISGSRRRDNQIIDEITDLVQNFASSGTKITLF